MPVVGSNGAEQCKPCFGCVAGYYHPQLKAGQVSRYASTLRVQGCVASAAIFESVLCRRCAGVHEMYESAAVAFVSFCAGSMRGGTPANS